MQCLEDPFLPNHTEIPSDTSGFCFYQYKKISFYIYDIYRITEWIPSFEGYLHFKIGVANNIP